VLPPHAIAVAGVFEAFEPELKTLPSETMYVTESLTLELKYTHWSRFT
jgi:hypothetical protein